MARQAQLLGPKFKLVDEIFSRELTGLDQVSWTQPKGGYFIGLWLPEGLAGKVVDLCRQAGLKLTPAGNPYPYSYNPADNFLRIAPSFCPAEELRQAAEVICLSVQLACMEKGQG